MAYPVCVHSVVLTEAGAANWTPRVTETITRVADRLGIGEEEAAQVAQYSAVVTEDGTLHMRMAAPGGERVEADVPFAEWQIQGRLQ